MFELDPMHESFNLWDDKIIMDVWRDKYMWPNEKTPEDVFARVADTIYKNDLGDNEKHKAAAYQAMCKGLWMPGGRILNGQGTFMNCYVARTIEDSIEGIYHTLGEAMTTLSKFGGIGMDFTPIRPAGAKIHRGDLVAPGPITFMGLWHEAAHKIMQAGHRRGAMMGVIADWHPDLPLFIKAKHTKGALTNFNVSVLVSSKFMEAVKYDQDWVLYHSVEPAEVRSSKVQSRDFSRGDTKYYAYAVYKARELWDMILQSTYEYSEPGVIFIDRINRLNNLNYCEEIRCTNPCGEQPLPPNGTCNLGAVNLARMVQNPFTSKASFNWTLLTDVVNVGIRFLDNVIDVTSYPLNEQAKEEQQKRRLGLGISGLADAMAQLDMCYGSQKSVDFAGYVMEAIAKEAYSASVRLAKERGNFPLYDPKIADRGFCKERLPVSLRNEIAAYGLRNGVLLTVAPTGTTSIVFGNLSSGIEPVFAHSTKRTVYRADGNQEQYVSWGFAARFYAHCWSHRNGDGFSYPPEVLKLPEHMAIADQVKPEEHIKVQAAVQHWVDASVSKTINCSKEITYEEFKNCYQLAYDLGCKGCTTYRSSEVRGAVLQQANSTEPKVEPTAAQTISVPKTKRPSVIAGCTYKINWPSLESAIYLTINEYEGKPWEVFLKSKDLRNIEWVTAVAIFISMHLQGGADPMALASQLKQIQSAHDQTWIGSKHHMSLISYIGHILEEHFSKYESKQDQAHNRTATSSGPQATEEKRKVAALEGERCPKCAAPRLIRQEGCKVCSNCGFSNCG